MVNSFPGCGPDLFIPLSNEAVYLEILRTQRSLSHDMAVFTHVVYQLYFFTLVQSSTIWPSCAWAPSDKENADAADDEDGGGGGPTT